MLPTPDTSHVSFENVYEPSEDSFLLLDALSKASETEQLHQRFQQGPCPLTIEVGVGSGVVLAFVAANVSTLLGRSDALFMGIDLNDFACKAARETFAVNVPGTNTRAALLLGCEQADLSSCLRPGQADVVIFNPPYVPSEQLPTQPAQGLGKFERDNALLALATDGGADGMQVTARLLAQLPQILSLRGVAYVLVCARNKPAAIKTAVGQWPGGWTAETVHTSGKQGGIENLEILRVGRRATDAVAAPKNLVT